MTASQVSNGAKIWLNGLLPKGDSTRSYLVKLRGTLYRQSIEQALLSETLHMSFVSGKITSPAF